MPTRMTSIVFLLSLDTCREDSKRELAFDPTCLNPIKEFSCHLLLLLVGRRIQHRYCGLTDLSCVRLATAAAPTSAVDAAAPSNMLAVRMHLYRARQLRRCDAPTCSFTGFRAHHSPPRPSPLCLAPDGNVD